MMRLVTGRNILFAAALMCAMGALAPAQQPAGNANTSYQVNPSEYVIGVDDVLAINVWKETEISRVVQVRPDGKISLPLVGEIQAAGQQPLQLQQQIADKLKSYISDPEVTVIVQEVHSKKFNVIGEVQRPGTYALSNSSTVLDAIALAGGFKDFAKQTKIYVLRIQPDGSRTRIPFNYKKVVKGKALKENVPLQNGDTIVVP